jgi:hypothetical protein
VPAHEHEKAILPVVSIIHEKAILPVVSIIAALHHVVHFSVSPLSGFAPAPGFTYH